MAEVYAHGLSSCYVLINNCFMLVVLFVSLILSWVFYLLVSADLFLRVTRFSSLKLRISKAFTTSFPLIFLSFLSILVGRFVFLMVMANFPLFSVPIMFYSYVLIYSILFWIAIIRFGLHRNFKSIVAHMLPYGAPSTLIIFLPLVEIFSQIIRPLTLTIRFSTNLSAGHIIIFMFSYFAMLSSVLAPFLYVVLLVLLTLEVIIAILQSYIFFTLLGLYLNETL